MSVDAKALARAERADFADLIAVLSDDQWQAQTSLAVDRVADVRGLMSRGHFHPSVGLG
ncbi:hypothetical protein OHA40_23080 [Nocardia sp. NBC_00508]|uniref:hypothetical protein n=1 Tax=Nocardia sp. NBC_00508 TaxID=2975992 RepID=UPI002E817162|nr:hypothetical protein [Nocardia sp. NBC_00508]WUD64554.1 hypothetical protein OHA40_23080 [Nocardia sp. NBC_00508]